MKTPQLWVLTCLILSGTSPVMARELMEREERIYGKNSYWTWMNKMLLAKILHQQERHEESEKIYRRLLEVRNLPERHIVIKNIEDELRHQDKDTEQSVLKMQQPGPANP